VSPTFELKQGLIVIPALIEGPRGDAKVDFRGGVVSLD
jgi:hypothetical protein